ncbi:MAG: nuclear transport factor 2 family protein [Paracoccaceae bacterium]
MNARAPLAAEDLAQRLARVEARAAIADLMQDYADAADRKYTALREKAPADEIAAAAQAQAACFTPDAVWSGGGFGGDLVGRGTIAEFFTRSPWVFTAHHYGSMAVRFASDEQADVRWRLIELGIPDGGGRVLLMTGAIAQDCQLTPDGWRIARMRFDRLHAVELADDPAALRCLIPAGESL